MQVNRTIQRSMVWIVLIFLCVAAAALVWKYKFADYHFATVQDGVLYRDGVRTIREFEITVRKAKPKTVVRLIDETEQQAEPFVSEAAYCKEHGITVIELPIKLGGWPNSEQLNAFLQLTADPSRRPLVVHCAQGVRRTGMMVAAYQESILGYDTEQAKRKMLTFGHSQRTVGDVMKFIDLYDAKTRSLTATLPVGKE